LFPDPTRTPPHVAVGEANGGGSHRAIELVLARVQPSSIAKMPLMVASKGRGDGTRSRMAWLAGTPPRPEQVFSSLRP
jgi:hypothetical protein